MVRPPRSIVRWIVAIVLCACGAASAVERPSVVLVVVDGLDAKAVNAMLTPTLWSLVEGEEPRGVFFPSARAVLPTVTNANHASLFTGVYPAAHGIVGNYVWERSSDTPRRRRLENRSAVAVPPLFEDLAKSGRRSALIVGKFKLVSLFGPEVPSASITVWGDLTAEAEIPDLRTGLSSDERTTDEVIRAITATSPDLVAVNLGDVDRTSHIFGPDSPQARKSVLEADRQIARLVGFLRETNRWNRTVLVVTADHGFSSVVGDAATPYRTLSFARELRRARIDDVAVVGNGAMAFVYLRNAAPSGPLAPASHDRLREVRALALAQPEVEEALYRVANPGDGGDAHTLGTAHPDWKLAHPSAGELVLVAREGHQFDDPPGVSARIVRGNHGGPAERDIPLLWSGGWPGLAERKTETARTADSPDVGATIREILGLPLPRRAGGNEVEAPLRGRVLEEVIAGRSSAAP